MTQTIQYIFDIGGNADAALQSITRNLTALDAALGASASAMQGWEAKAAALAGSGATALGVSLEAVVRALSGCGAAAAAAGVSFEQAAGAAAELCRAGRDCSALEGILETLARPDVVPPDMLARLAAAGADMAALSDGSLGLSERLAALGAAAGDSALMAALFGSGNAAAAAMLAGSSEGIDVFARLVTGTLDAYAQASGAADACADSQSRMHRTAYNIHETLLGLTGQVGVWTGGLVEALLPLNDMVELAESLGKTYGGLAWTVNAVTGAVKSSSAATKVWTVIQAGFNAVMALNPVVWVVAGIAALVAGVVVCWNRFAGFRAFLITCWETVKHFGGVLVSAVLDPVMNLVRGIGTLGSAIVKLFKGDFSGAWDAAKTGFGQMVGTDEKPRNKKSEGGKFSVGDTFRRNLAAERAKEAPAEGGAGSIGVAAGLESAAPDMGSLPVGAGAAAQSFGAAAPGAGARSVNITIEKLVENFTVEATTLGEGAERIKELVQQALVDAVNDVNYAV